MSIARGLGLTIYKPEKAYNGFTLFTPSCREPGITWLIDMEGRFVHRWQLPEVVRLHAELLPAGNLLAGTSSGKPKELEDLADSTSEKRRSPDSSKKRPFKSLHAGGQAVELDWDSNIVWRYADPYLNHHDRIRMKNGNTMIHKFVPVPKDIQVKVKGGFPGTDEEIMWGDIYQELNPDGKVVWDWIAHEHLDPELDPLHHMSPRTQWSTSNALVELPDGNIMASCQFISRVYIIDKVTGDIKWRWGYPESTFQHNPTLLDNGNILLLDNRRWMPWTSVCYSRVVEVNPTTQEIEWEYVAENPREFFTGVMGGCQRLPNGNTLICEAVCGRLFEVTTSGETVWEYINPFYDWHPFNPLFGRTNMVHRAYRYSPDYPGLQGKKIGPEKLDLWNQLYATKASGAWTKATWGTMERTHLEGERATIEGKVSPAKYEESKPSVGQPGPGKKMRSRLENLGY